jgi:predicted RNA binding protein YcfA (HicA-like mRNA interferase family)
VTRLTLLTAADLARLLGELGFEFIRQKGSHAFFRHPDGRATVIPVHRGETIRRGLLRSILRDIDLTPTDYEKIRRTF